MTSKTDPPRLRSLRAYDPDGLVSALDDLDCERPTSEQLRDVRTNLGLVLGLPPPAGQPVQPPSSAPPAPTGPIIGSTIKTSMTLAHWVPWVMAGALGGAAVIGASQQWRHELGPVPAPIVERVSAPPAAATPTHPTLDEPPSPAGAPAAEPRPTLSVSNRAALPSPTRSVPAAEEEATHRLTERPSMHEGAPAAEAPPPATEVTEISLLTRAQQALGSDPSKSLEIVADHERQFANGLLVQEREVIAIDALIRLRRYNEAEARATNFHARFPASAHGRRVDVLLRSTPK